MARVPTYQEGQIQKRPLPSVTFTASASASHFGAANFAAVQQLGSSVNLLPLAKAIRDDEIRQSEIKNKALTRDTLTQAENEIRNLTDQIYSMQGRDATDVYNPARQQLSKMRSDYLGKLQNDQQKQMFAANFDDYGNKVLGRIANFQRKSLRDYDRVTKESQNNGYRKDILSDPYNEKLGDERIRDIRANTSSLLNGYDAEFRKAQEDKAEASVRQDALNQFVDTDPVYGMEYLEKHGDVLDPLVKNEIKGRLQKAKTVHTANAVTSDVMASGADLSQAYTEIEEAGKINKLSETEIEYHKKFAAQRYETRKKEVNMEFNTLKAKGDQPTPLQIAALKQFNPVRYAKFSEEPESLPYDDRNALRTFNRELGQETFSARDDINEQNYNKYNDRIDTLNVTETTKIELRSQLDKKFSNPQTGQNDADINRYIQSYHKGLDAEDKDQMFEEMQRRIEELPKDKRTRNEINLIGDELNKNVVIKEGIFFDASRKAYKLPYLDDQETREYKITTAPPEVKKIPGYDYSIKEKAYVVNDGYDDNGNIRFRYLTGPKKGSVAVVKPKSRSRLYRSFR